MENDSDQSLNTTTYASSYAILKHLLLPLLSMIIKILSRRFLKDFKLIYIECKIKYTYRKIKIPANKSKILLSIPCIFIFLIVSLHEKESVCITDEIKKDTSCELFSPSYMIESTTIRSHVLNDQLAFYALSKLHFINHSSFSKYLLLLSGDIDINPGPTVTCCI